MKKILYLPLDERPCNYVFPQLIARQTNYQMIVPPPEILGDKKKPGDVEALWKWLEGNASSAACAIISTDMLVYGGIVPSRLHNFSAEQCLTRISRLEKLKSLNPELAIYAFSLIMRCPQYSSSDEEPDYYEKHGESIFKRKYLEHKQALGLATEKEKDEYRKIQIPENILKDFEGRRNTNIQVNLGILNLLKKDIIDFLIIPQDDSAPYGYTALDQQKVRAFMKNNSLMLKAYMYPGADEAGCTLLARFINIERELKPLVKVKFPGIRAPFVIPLYEDRILYESVKYQVLAAGCLITESDDGADLYLFVNSPGSNMIEAREQNSQSTGYDIERNLPEFVEQADYYVKSMNAKVIIADVAYANGSDLNLVEMLKQKEILLKLAGYAGWNTSSNTIGTALADGVAFNAFGNLPAHREFLALRFIEDAGFCSQVRWDVTENDLPQMGFDYFRIDGKSGKVSEVVKTKLQAFSDKLFECEKLKPLITSCHMPWNRMFEVGINVRFK